MQTKSFLGASLFTPAGQCQNTWLQSKKNADTRLACLQVRHIMKPKIWQERPWIVEQEWDTVVLWKLQQLVSSFPKLSLRVVKHNGKHTPVSVFYSWVSHQQAQQQLYCGLNLIIILLMSPRYWTKSVSLLLFCCHWPHLTALSGRVLTSSLKTCCSNPGSCIFFRHLFLRAISLIALSSFCV